MGRLYNALRAAATLRRVRHSPWVFRCPPMPAPDLLPLAPVPASAGPPTVVADAPYRVVERERGLLATFRVLRRGLLPMVHLFDAMGGDMARVRTRIRTSVLLRHPDLIRALLVEHDAAFTKSEGLRLAKDVLGEGLLTSEPPFHTRQRRLVLPAFHHQKLRGYAEAMVGAADETAAAWADGQPLAMDAEMNRLALVIAGRTLFSAEIADEASDISRAIHTAMALFETRAQNPLTPILRRLPLASNRRFWRALGDLDETVLRLIAERRASHESKDDLLQMLLDAQDEDGSAMTDRQVRDEAMTLLMAGHETTAGALAWTWMLLAQHPDVRQRLFDEVDDVLAGRAPTFDDAKALPYTRAVFAEAMRLCPPAWAVGREAARDVSLAPGVDIRRGETVLFAPLFLHRDPRFWDDPEAFRPERFLDKTERHKFAYVPFSAGRRGCIGEQFAWTEGLLVIAALARHWRFESNGPAPEFFGSVTLRPSAPIRLTAHRRRS